MSDLPGLPVEPAEPVPNQLRILAMMQNLGTLHSIHRPASWFTNLQFRNGRVYVFDQGFVLGLAGGERLSLFRRGQFTLRKVGGSYLVTGADGRRMSLSRKWSGFAELEKAITEGAAAGGTSTGGKGADLGAAAVPDRGADLGADSGASAAPDLRTEPGSTAGQ